MAFSRRSMGSVASPVTIQNSNNNNIIKRRSHSDTILPRTDQIEIPVIHTQSRESPSNLQAKVPKLEIRSPVLGLPLPVSNSLSTSDYASPLKTMSPGSHGNKVPSSQRRSTFSSHSKIPQPSSKRSRSSENLNVTQLMGSNKGPLRSTSPFSFSLTTPNSSLFSFKTYGKSNHGNPSVPNKSRSLTSSPTSLLYPTSKR